MTFLSVDNYTGWELSLWISAYGLIVDNLPSGGNAGPGCSLGGLFRRGLASKPGREGREDDRITGSGNPYRYESLGLFTCKHVSM